MQSFFQSRLSHAALTGLILGLCPAGAPVAQAVVYTLTYDPSWATSGTVTNYNENGTNFIAHIFTNSSDTLAVRHGVDIQYLIVAGDDADPDHDGLLNWMERYAGTDPTNAASRLTLSAPTNNPASAGQFVLCWQSVEGKSYALQAATNLTAGFTSLLLHVPATPPMNVHTDDTGNTAGRFYRVKVE